MAKKNNNKNTIDKPHDKALFSALRNHNIARDAIKSCLPAELLEQLDLHAIKPYRTKMVSPQMKAFEADIFYEIPFKNSKALVLFHCEQESNPNPIIALRVWQYILLVLMDYAENHPKEALPVPFPVIVYTGERKFTHSTYLFDLFGENKDLAESLFYQGIKLIDVCRMSDEDIRKHRLFGLCEYAFKHKKRADFEDFLKVLIPWLHEVECQIGPYYAKILVHYVVDEFKHGDMDLFLDEVKIHLSKELGDEAMTIAQQLRQEGMQQGVQQGIQQGMQQGIRQGMQFEKCEIAKKLLMQKMPVGLIAEATDLTIAEVKALRKELVPTKH